MSRDDALSARDGAPTIAKTRRYHAKTRTGCLTCRIRRVKCDEAKPHCGKCTSTGRKCDGYATSPSPQQVSPAESPPPAVSPLTPCSTALERRAFDWFRSRTLTVISGHFGDDTYDRIALQLYHAEPAVRHTINAFGALHLEINSLVFARSQGVDASLRMALPVKQHSLALQELQKLLNQQNVPINVVLVCSLLLMQFEGLREDFVPAMLHAKKALRLLSTNRRRIDGSLLRTMMRFDVQSAIHAGRKSPQLTHLASHLDTAPPPALTCALEVRHLVTTWSSRFYAFEQAVVDEYTVDPGNVRLEHMAEAQAFQQIFARLDRTLSAFATTRHSKLSIREQHGLQIFRARTKILRMLAATCLYSEATVFDRYQADFENILDICSALLSDPRANRSLFVLHVDEGLMYPLYVVATYCRHSRTRHAALNLLLSLPKGNWSRIWHASIVLRTAKLIIDYEEAGQKNLESSDVPEWRRVHNPSFDHLDTASWHGIVGGPLRVRPNGMDGEWMDLRELANVPFPEHADDGSTRKGAQAMK